MAAEKMLKFVTVGRDMPQKRTAEERRHDFLEIYGDFAITRGDSENHLVNSVGKEFHFTSHWTAVCRKIDGQWKIVRAHSSLDPFGNPMLIDGVTKRIVLTTVIAAVGGLIIGSLATYFVIRRRGGHTFA